MTGSNWRPRSALWLLGLAVWVGAAYYAGAALGLALKLPHATPSVLWPPNAILTCALLLTPLRLWPLVLLAALPTHILIESGVDGWPMAMIAGLFATNCTEAIIGAATIKWFSDAPTRFDSLKRVGIFMAGAVLAGPLVSSFLDAGIVYLTRGEPYWAVWRARLFANALSELTIVPAVIVTVTSTRAWLRSASRARLLEALVFAALLTVAAVVILDPGQQATAQAVARRAPLVALLPFILWATIRFGPGGTSVTLLLSTLAVVEASVASRGPFEGFSPTDTTRALQLYLIVIAATMLSVAALIEERKLAQQNLSDRLAFEGLLARLSGAFVELPSDRMRAGFDEGLRYVAAFFAADRVRVYQCTHEQSDFVPLSTWAVEDVVTPGMAVHRDFPWSMRQLLLRHSVILERLTDLPPEADIDRQSYAAHGASR